MAMKGKEQKYDVYELSEKEEKVSPIIPFSIQRRETKIT